MRHSWNHNDPEEGWSTCVNCGMVVKTWRVHKGGLPKCKQREEGGLHQSDLEGKIDYIPPCMDEHYTVKLGDKDSYEIIEHPNPVISCFECSGRIVPSKCDNLRKHGKSTRWLYNGV